MQWLIVLLLSIITLSIFYQDFKNRSVIWILFPCIVIVGIFYCLYYSHSLRILTLNSIFNFSFLLLQFVLLKIVFRFKKIINYKIGTGDVFFIVCCCTFFSPIYFLVFYILSLIFSLSSHFVLRLFSKDYNDKTIPLAGLQSIFLFVFISIHTMINTSTVNDDVIIYLING